MKLIIAADEIGMIIRSGKGANGSTLEANLSDVTIIVQKLRSLAAKLESLIEHSID